MSRGPGRLQHDIFNFLWPDTRLGYPKCTTAEIAEWIADFRYPDGDEPDWFVRQVRRALVSLERQGWVEHVVVANDEYLSGQATMFMWRQVEDAYERWRDW